MTSPCRTAVSKFPAPPLSTSEKYLSSTSKYSSREIPTYTEIPRLLYQCKVGTVMANNFTTWRVESRGLPCITVTCLVGQVSKWFVNYFILRRGAWRRESLVFDVYHGVDKWSDVGISDVVWARACHLGSEKSPTQKSRCRKWCMEKNPKFFKYRMFRIRFKKEERIAYGHFSTLVK